MTKSQDRLAPYKGVLPYATEMFGIYQPLLGWKSERMQSRITRSTAIQKEGLLKTLLGQTDSQVEATYDSANENATGASTGLQVQKILPGVSRPAEAIGGLLMAAVRQTLPEPSAYKPDIWKDMLASDRLEQALTAHVVPAAQKLYDQLKAQHQGASMALGADHARGVVASLLARESKIAGLLAQLNGKGMHDLLHKMFYGPESVDRGLWSSLLTVEDPYTSIDPSHVLDRVGLSPVGVAHLFRQYFFELDTFLGTPAGHVWVAPGTTVELTEVHTRRTYQEQTLEQSIETLQHSEKSLTLQDDLSDAVKEDNRTGTKLGVSVSSNQNWVWGSASESASFNLDTTQDKSRETAHKSMRQQSEKLSEDIKRNFKSTFRTTTETTDTSTKRYVLSNSSNEIHNYELRRKMRQVAVQVQDVGTYLCWQTYVDVPGTELGLAKLIHIGAPPDLSKIPPPEMIVPPDSFSEQVTLTIPFVDSGDGASNDDTFNDGAEVSLGIGDGVNHIIADFAQGPFHCAQPDFRLATVALDVGGADAKLSVQQIQGSGSSGWTFVIHLDHINFQSTNSISVKATFHWEPIIDEAGIKAENAKRLALFTAREKEAFRNAFVEAARERVRLSSNITPRRFEELREEERVVIYRKLVQDMLAPINLVPQPDPQTQHVVAEVISAIFDVDKMLYFVAPEWWRPHAHVHQQLGGLDVVTDANGTKIGYAGIIPSQDVTAWGEADKRIDSYYITEESAPARMGSSLGWVLQLDGDDLRNAFLNAPWVKAVIPIRPGKEKAALAWLRHVEGMASIGPNDLYMGPEPAWQGKTIFEVLDILAGQIGEKYKLSTETKTYKDPLDDSNTVTCTPIDRVFEHGFDPLKGGFRVVSSEPFEIFDQWLEVLPTDQVVAVEVHYDPKTGRQL